MYDFIVALVIATLSGIIAEVLGPLILEWIKKLGKRGAARGKRMRTKER